MILKRWGTDQTARGQERDEAAARLRRGNHTREPDIQTTILNLSLTAETYPAIAKVPGSRRVTHLGPFGGAMLRIDFNRLRFLVIDDNVHMRRIVRTLLHGFGAREVYEAEDGASGLEAFTHFVPDIIIADWAMPIFDGLELTQMIRQPGANANPYVPIIMLTGHSEKHRVTSARDAGITEFMAKPISAKALYQRILNVVANPRPFIKTKSYFGPDRRRNVTSNYVGPERRKGGKADTIRQAALIEKAKVVI
jgi:two-component system chemotaxis response regulator CheY